MNLEKLQKILEKLRKVEGITQERLIEIEQDLKEGRLEEARDKLKEVLENTINEIEEKLFQEEAKFARAVNEWALKEEDPKVKEAVKEYNEGVQKIMEEFHQRMTELIQELDSLS